MEKRETKTSLGIAVTKSARVVQTASAREIANTAKLLEDGGDDQDEPAYALKSKRKTEDGPLKENKRQERMSKGKGNDGGTSVLRMTRDIDGDADDATVMSEIPCVDLGQVASAQDHKGLPKQKKKRQRHQKQQQQEEDHVFFDPTTIIASHLAIEGIDIGASFRLLQEEAAPVVNDSKKMLTLDQLPRFLAANHIWDTSYQLPGMSDDERDVVQAALCVPVVRLSDQLMSFCRSLVHDLTSKGYICSRNTKSRDQDALLVLLQQT
ncbi:hypothetical protein BGZ96_001334 [Linnemannia gamsii]|uniref:Uncharacterized protein n=1 Tax=Linnemannia gamsii TaxID=64522 RepID=A0ABQ7JMF6_9FUNG|nr:hypothetical protein BGZ96_001334 [Linnemannia gamsii]